MSTASGMATRNEPCITPHLAKTRFSCASCGRGWTGYVECHCDSCHQHFTHVNNFDAHRIFAGLKGDWSSRRCLTREEIKGLKRSNGKPIYTESTGPLGKAWAQAST